MLIHLTPPLAVSAATGRTLELMPVIMDTLPGRSDDQWAAFLKPDGQRIPLSPREVQRVQSYMQLNRTDAVSEDAKVAFTVSGTALVECLP